MDLAARDKFIVVYAQGLNGSDGKLGWNDCRADNSDNPTSDDVKFINSLISSSLYPADPHRVYVVGSSNGGMMALRMALDSPKTVAAIGAVIANMPADSECATPVVPTPVLFMNGTADPEVPYAGGVVADRPNKGTVKSVAESIRFWTTLNSVSPRPTSTVKLPDLDHSDSSTVTFSTYTGNNANAVFEYTVSGGGHLEPSIQERYSSLIQRILGKQNHDLEMANAIWSFLKGHSR